jgi:putative endonuclease
MAEHNEIGTKGESLAVVFLKEKGYTILETNWRYKNLEADIIATNNNQLIVVEVKTRKSNYFGEPESFVDKQKQKNIIRAANAYILQHNLNLDVRFDIVSIIIGSSKQQINHIEDAFYAGIK